MGAINLYDCDVTIYNETHEVVGLEVGEIEDDGDDCICDECAEKWGLIDLVVTPPSNFDNWEDEEFGKDFNALCDEFQDGIYILYEKYGWVEPKDGHGDVGAECTE